MLNQKSVHNMDFFLHNNLLHYVAPLDYVKSWIMLNDDERLREMPRYPAKSLLLDLEVPDYRVGSLRFAVKRALHLASWFGGGSHKADRMTQIAK